MRLPSVAWTLATVLAASPAAWAGQIWVAPGGDGDGTSRAAAMGSLADAIRAARPGDTVLVARGRYEGGVWVETSGAPGRPIVVRAADGPRTAVLEGGGETLNVGDGAHDLVFEGLELRNSGDNIVHVQGNAHHIVLRDLWVHDAGEDGDGIKVNQASDVLIERVECYHPGVRPGSPGGNPAQECIDLVDVARAVVQDCFLHDGGNMLLYAKGASRDVVFQRNVVAGQGAGAIDPCVGLGAATDAELLRGRPYEAEDVVFRNNVVVGCVAGAVGIYDARHVWVVNNTLLDAGPEVVQFRAGNAPGAESRDVHLLNNVIADGGGAMQRAVVRLSHAVAELEVRNNLYWNGDQPVPADGLVDPTREQGGLRADPALGGLSPRPRDRAGYVLAATPRAHSAAIDRAAALAGPGAAVDDLRGHRRPTGRASDLGALEFDGVAVPPPATATVRRADASVRTPRAGATPVAGLGLVLAVSSAGAWAWKRRGTDRRA